MLIKIGYELIFNNPAPVNMLMALYVHPEQADVLGKPERLVVEPDVPIQNYIDHFGNRVGRCLAPAGPFRIYYDNIAEDSGKPEPRIDGARLHPVEELPSECMEFLIPSRYCEVDNMTQMAWDLFGNTPFSWERVQAVVNWVHANVKFGYQFARKDKTAIEVSREKQGVCRDFQHLAISLLRALNIPARYATGYLGDIGVPVSSAAMDFSAWMEVYLGGHWYTMDARHNAYRIGRILQARGRDAVDVALTTTFGPNYLQKFTVWTDEVK
jgi:transglutaminase-like putative cysteine protease